MVLLESHQVIAPLHIVSSHHTVCLNFKRVVGNYLKTGSEHLRHMHLLLFRAEGVVADCRVVLYNFVKMSHILDHELRHVLVAEAYDFKGSLHDFEIARVSFLVVY